MPERRVTRFAVAVAHGAHRTGGECPLHQHLARHVGEHGRVAHDGLLLNAESAGRIKHVRHRCNRAAEVPLFIDGMERQTFREMFRMVLVELRRPASFVDGLREDAMIEVVLME